MEWTLKARRMLQKANISHCIQLAELEQLDQQQRTLIDAYIASPDAILLQLNE